MEYLYKEIEAEYEEIRFRNAGTWKYIPLETFHRTGKDKECIIFGDVTGAMGESAINYVSMQNKDIKKKIRLFRYQNKLAMFDKVIGYIPALNSNGKEGYVRIRKKSTKNIVLTLLLIILIIAVGCFALQKNNGPDLDKNAIAYQLPNGAKNTDPNSIMLPGYDVLEMDEASQKVSAALLNPEGNECYFKFHVILKSNETELYQTGLIKPGMAVTSFKVNKKLKKGQYPIIIKVDATDLKNTDESYNGGAVEAILEVK